MKRATNQRTMVEKSKTPGKSRSSPAHRFFIYKVGMLRRALDRYSTPAITDQFDMTLAEWRVLTLLYGSSPATVRELCDLLQADKAEVSRACAGLVKRGLALRRGDHDDARSALISITARGERRHDAIVPVRQSLQDELERALSRSEIAEFHRLLDKLVAHVRQTMATPNDASLRATKVDVPRKTKAPQTKRVRKSK
jgi:DNA-binding MarR family transcriptional regulator